MNKILSLLLLILIFCSGINAQEGKYALDFNVNPAALFDANAGSMFQMPNIKGRYFLSSGMAARLGLGVGFSNDKDYTDIEGNEYMKSSSASITLAPGIEKGFGTEKFNGYVGVDLPIALYTNSTEVKVGTVTTKTKNPNGAGYFVVGLSAIFGFDYYLFGNVYVGAEFSPGLMFQKYNDIIVDDTVTNKGGTGLDFYLSSSSGIRLGVRF